MPVNVNIPYIARCMFGNDIFNSVSGWLDFQRNTAVRWRGRFMSYPPWCVKEESTLDSHQIKFHIYLGCIYLLQCNNRIMQ